MRWPLGHHGVADVRRTLELATTLPLVARCHQHTAALGGTLALDTDGQWLDLTGDAPVGALRAWLDVLAGLLGVAVPATGDVRRRQRVRPPEPEPFVLGDAAWRRQQLAGERPAPPQWTLAQLVGPEAVTVVVADEDRPRWVPWCARRSGPQDSRWASQRRPSPARRPLRRA